MTDNKNVELNEQEMANAVGGISQLPDMEDVEGFVKLSAKIVKDTYFKDVSLEDMGHLFLLENVRYNNRLDRIMTV